VKTVLVSFLGTGGRAKGEKKEYSKTVYRLPSGEKVETKLITSVLFNYLKPDKLIIIGTPQSVWSELEELSPSLEETPEYEEIFEQVWGKKNVDFDSLKRWEEAISKTLNKEISLCLVDEAEEEEIVKALNEEIPENTSLYLDITHAFRHFPLVAAFFIPTLRYLKNLRDVKLIYGKYAKENEKLPSEVIFLDIAGKLVNLLEAVALVKNTGNFEKFASILGEKELEKLYLRVETNRPLRDREIGRIKEKLEETLNRDILTSIASSVLKKDVIPYLEADSIEERMAKRALFFAERKQFLKAYTLMIESIILLSSKVFQIKDLKYSHNRFETIYNNLPAPYREYYKTINTIRNAIAHGDINLHDKTKITLSKEEKLKDWIKKGYETVKYLLKQKEKKHENLSS